MNRQRQIKGKDWNGYEYQYGIVLSEHSVGNWNTRCKLCSEIHVMQNRALRVGARSKKCKQYRSPNWTGFEGKMPLFVGNMAYPCKNLISYWNFKNMVALFVTNQLQNLVGA
jgi:hypothetical protein